jgi:pilus assembly protein CpaD
MNTNRSSFVVLALTLLLGACASPTTYSDAEAPKTLRLDTATTQLDLRFAPGSATLAPADAVRLRQLAANGGIAPSDRVTIAAAGPPDLAQLRMASVSSQLLRFGIVANPDRLAEVPPERAVVVVTRTLVTLPACPNFSKPSNSDFGNQPSSNFGCANQTNFGMMVANPTDLASGLPVAGSAGQPAAAAINRYMNDKVVLPTANTALPIAAASQSGPSNSPSSTGSP